MHAGEELVDHLDLRALARPIAQAVDLGRNRREHVLARSERRRGARGHDRHLARRRLGGAAGDRRVEHEEAAPGEPLAEALGEVGRRGDAQDHDATGGHRGRGAVRAEQHAFGLLGVDDEDRDDAGLRTELRRARARNAAGGGKGVERVASHIAGGGGETRPQQRARSAHAHRAESDDPDRSCCHVSPSLRRAIDYAGYPTTRHPRRHDASHGRVRHRPVRPAVRRPAAPARAGALRRRREPAGAGAHGRAALAARQRAHPLDRRRGRRGRPRRGRGAHRRRPRRRRARHHRGIVQAPAARRLADVRAAASRARARRGCATSATRSRSWSPRRRRRRRTPPSWSRSTTSRCRRSRRRRTRARPGAPAVWDECPDNVSHVFEMGDRAATEAAFARAARVVRGRYLVNRVHGQYMEPRGAVGALRPGRGALHAPHRFAVRAPHARRPGRPGLPRPRERDPRRRPRRRRRLRHEGAAVPRGPPRPVGGAKARPAGELDVRAQRDDPHRRAGARPHQRRRAGARPRRPVPRAAGADDRDRRLISSDRNLPAPSTTSARLASTYTFDAVHARCHRRPDEHRARSAPIAAPAGRRRPT